MWYAILFILNLQTGVNTFSIFTLPFETYQQCAQALAPLENNYGSGFVIKYGCAEIPENIKI